MDRIVRPAEYHLIVARLTVVKGYAQLLRRAILQPSHDPARLLDLNTRLHGQIDDLIALLNGLDRDRSMDRPEEQDEPDIK